MEPPGFCVGDLLHVLLVCEKFMENPEFCAVNFAVNLKCEISHAKLKSHKHPPPPQLYAVPGQW